MSARDEQSKCGLFNSASAFLFCVNYLGFRNLDNQSQHGSFSRGCTPYPRFAASLTPPPLYISLNFSYAALGCRMLLSVRVWFPIVSGILCSRSFVRKKWVMDIFTFIRGLFSNDLYIQVWEKRLKVSNIQTREVYEIEPLMAIEIQPKGHRVVFKIGASCKSLDAKKYQIINPFSHPRSLLADFEVVEKLLQHAIRECSGTVILAT